MLEITNPRLHELSDDHITLANTQAATHNPKQVSAGLTLAAGRYAAFFCHHASQSKDEMIAKREASIRFFSEEFSRMFARDYDDYVENFDRYRSASNNPPA